MAMGHIHSLSLVLLLLLVGCRAEPKKSSGVQERLNETALLLDTDSIDSIKLVHSLPGEHWPRITLDSLVNGGTYALQLSRSAIELHSGELAEAFRSADASNSKWSGEVNWAIVLYDQGGKERARIGFDESGHNGYIGADAVQLKGSGIAKWARRTLPK